MQARGLKTTHNQASSSPVQQMALVLDHLVDALGGDPSCTLRRAVILAEIDENPGITQASLNSNLKLHKSALNRDVDWLYDHGCVLLQAGVADARVIHITTCGYSKKNIDLALDYFEGSHKKLKLFLESLISMFKDHKPTFRDAKMLATLADLGNDVSRQELFSRVYNSPPTTNIRALEGLIDEGLVAKKETDSEYDIKQEAEAV